MHTGRMETQREREQDFLMRLWTAAAEAGLNDKQLAAALGVSSPTVSRLKSGQLARGRRGGLSLRVVASAVERFPALAFALPIGMPVGIAIRPTGGAS